MNKSDPNKQNKAKQNKSLSYGEELSCESCDSSYWSVIILLLLQFFFLSLSHNISLSHQMKLSIL